MKLPQIQALERRARLAFVILIVLVGVAARLTLSWQVQFPVQDGSYFLDNARSFAASWRFEGNTTVDPLHTRTSFPVPFDMGYLGYLLPLGLLARLTGGDPLLAHRLLVSVLHVLSTAILWALLLPPRESRESVLDIGWGGGLLVGLWLLHPELLFWHCLPYADFLFHTIVLASSWVLAGPALNGRSGFTLRRVFLAGLILGLGCTTRIEGFFLLAAWIVAFAWTRGIPKAAWTALLSGAILPTAGYIIRDWMVFGTPLHSLQYNFFRATVGFERPQVDANWLARPLHFWKGLGVALDPVSSQSLFHVNGLILIPAFLAFAWVFFAAARGEKSRLLVAPGIYAVALILGFATHEGRGPFEWYFSRRHSLSLMAVSVFYGAVVLRYAPVAARRAVVLLFLVFLVTYARHTRHVASSANFTVNVPDSFQELHDNEGGLLSTQRTPVLSDNATWIGWRLERPAVLYLPFPHYAPAPLLIERYGIRDAVLSKEAADVFEEQMSAGTYRKVAILGKPGVWQLHVYTLNSAKK